MRALLAAAWFLALTGCRFDLDAVDRPPGLPDGDGGGGGDEDGGAGGDASPVADPCGAEAPAEVSLHGAVIDAATGTPIAGALVDATPGGNALSGGDGRFAIDVALDGVATPIRLTFDANNGMYPFHRREFQRPFARPEVDVQPRLHSFAQLDGTTLYGYQDNPARTAGMATVIAWVFDCSDDGVAAAELDVAPVADAVVYYGGGSSTNASGVAYALNVPPGEIALSATGTEPFTLVAEPDSVVVAQLLVP